MTKQIAKHFIDVFLVKTRLNVLRAQYLSKK